MLAPRSKYALQREAYVRYLVAVAAVETVVIAAVQTSEWQTESEGLTSLQRVYSIQEKATGTFEEWEAAESQARLTASERALGALRPICIKCVNLSDGS